MKIKHITPLSIMFCLSLIFWTCTHTTENPPKPVIVAPSDLVYSTKVIEIVAGQSAKSVKPTLKGDAPFTFSLTSNPTASGLSIDNEGVVSVANNLAENTYKISVTVKNAGGSNTFAEIITVIVKSAIPVITAPANLSYSPNTLTLTQNTSANSVVPTITGTTPISYAITTNPSTNSITINAMTGVISASPTLAAGTYMVNVTATNGSIIPVVFNNAYTITVSSTQIAPSNLRYTPNTLTLTQNTSANSVMPTITGTTPISYAITTNPSTNNIAINAMTGVISASSTLTVGTYTVNVTATNGTITPVVFNSAYTITVNASVPTRTTFEGDVRTILTNNGCIGCHSDLSNYNTSKNRVNLILDRIQRQSNQAGFMPQGGMKMQDAQINAIKKWLSDGLLER